MAMPTFSLEYNLRLKAGTRTGWNATAVTMHRGVRKLNLIQWKKLPLETGVAPTSAPCQVFCRR